MASLNATKKAPILNNDGALLGTGYTVSSSNPATAKVTTESGKFYLTGIVAGDVVVTATRAVDGAVATLDVEVVAAAPFTISLGAESPA